jgi:hypothetical protein
VLNVVTKVKNQGQCGSCWAFSAVAALESLRFQAYKVIADFSEQQLVDCSGSYGNGGCNGGWMNNAFNYTKVMGITNESLYAYTATNGACKPLTGTLFKISNYATVSANCDAVAAAVVLRPLSVAVDASNWVCTSTESLATVPLPSTTECFLWVSTKQNGRSRIPGELGGENWGSSDSVRLVATALAQYAATPAIPLSDSWPDPSNYPQLLTFFRF